MCQTYLEKWRLAHLASESKELARHHLDSRSKKTAEGTEHQQPFYDTAKK